MRMEVNDGVGYGGDRRGLTPVPSVHEWGRDRGLPGEKEKLGITPGR